MSSKITGWGALLPVLVSETHKYLEIEDIHSSTNGVCKSWQRALEPAMKYHYERAFGPDDKWKEKIKACFARRTIALQDLQSIERNPSYKAIQELVNAGVTDIQQFIPMLKQLDLFLHTLTPASSQFKRSLTKFSYDLFHLCNGYEKKELKHFLDLIKDIQRAPCFILSPGRVWGVLLPNVVKFAKGQVGNTDGYIIADGHMGDVMICANKFLGSDSKYPRKGNKLGPNQFSKMVILNSLIHGPFIAKGQAGHFWEQFANYPHVTTVQLVGCVCPNPATFLTTFNMVSQKNSSVLKNVKQLQFVKCFDEEGNPIENDMNTSAQFEQRKVQLSVIPVGKRDLYWGPNQYKYMGGEFLSMYLGHRNL